jgi:CRISPR-associated endonuclease/helicase Cas3
MLSEKCYFAHSLPDADALRWQSLKDDLLAVERLAGQRGEKFGAAGIAGQSGLLHDLGKYTAGFQKRLRGGASVDHSTAAGAAEIRALAGSCAEARFMAHIVAHCIAGHHAGLPDSIGDLDDRLKGLKKSLEPLDAVWREDISPEPALLKAPQFRWREAKDEKLFQYGVLGRMIFSCLVDGDFRDTEDFYAQAQNIPKDRDWPKLAEIVEDLIDRLDRRLADLGSRAGDTKVNQLRGEILTHVRACAAKSRGAFSLNVPTGGGKTLASLAFALDHARRYGLERIIYAIPFTSVIDQTAAIFKGILGEEVVLEHHSSLDEEKLGGREARDKLRLAMEDFRQCAAAPGAVSFFRPPRCFRARLCHRKDREPARWAATRLARWRPDARRRAHKNRERRPETGPTAAPSRGGVGRSRQLARYGR